MCEQHPGLEFEHDPDCAGPGMPWMIEGKDAIESALGTAKQAEWDEATRIVKAEHGGAACVEQLARQAAEKLRSQGLLISDSAIPDTMDIISETFHNST